MAEGEAATSTRMVLLRHNSSPSVELLVDGEARREYEPSSIDDE